MVRERAAKLFSGGFTLVELLVVIAIISILASLLLPVLRGAKESAYQVSCASQAKQIYTAHELYCQDNRGYYPHSYLPYGSAPGGWPTAKYWFYTIGLYFDYKNQIGLEDKPLFRCPGWKKPNEFFTGPAESYMSCGGWAFSMHYSYTPDGWNFLRKQSIMQRYNIIMLVDSADEWNHGRGTGCPDVGGYTGLYHNSGANYTFTDGHIEWSGVYWNKDIYSWRKMPYAPCANFPKELPIE